MANRLLNSTLSIDLHLHEKVIDQPWFSEDSLCHVWSKKMTQVDVIMTAFNAEQFISDSINSIVRQTHKEWRLIVVDDGSTDGTRAIVENFQKIESRVHLINAITFIRR